MRKYAAKNYKSQVAKQNIVNEINVVKRFSEEHSVYKYVKKH